MGFCYVRPVNSVPYTRASWCYSHFFYTSSIGRKPIRVIVERQQGLPTVYCSAAGESIAADRRSSSSIACQGGIGGLRRLGDWLDCGLVFIPTPRRFLGIIELLSVKRYNYALLGEW